MIAGFWQRYSSRRPLLYGPKDGLVGKDCDGRVLALHCEGTNLWGDQVKQPGRTTAEMPIVKVRTALHSCVHSWFVY